MKTKNTVTAKGGNIQHTLEDGVDKASVAAHNSIDSMSKAAHPAVDHMASSAHVAVERVGVAATNTAETLGIKGDQLNHSGKIIADRASGYVREHPVASLGIAVAAGYILSRLLSSR